MDEKTRLIHAGRSCGELARTVGPPIQRGSTVLLPDSRSLYSEALGYGRAGLAAQASLKDALAELEGASSVQLYPSGLSALAGALLAVLKAGDAVLLTEGAYKPTRAFCEHTLARYGVRIELYDPHLAPDEVMALVKPDTRLILLESPSSLTFEVQDVPAIAAAAKARGVLTLMDNTWAAGLFFKPLDHEVDISVQALTKYVCGHSDIFMGSAAARDPKIGQLLEDNVHQLGWAVSGEDAYQALRGLRTLATRLARHDENARAVAGWLSGQPQVNRVLHPALPGAPGHALWDRDFSGASGLFGFTLKPCPIEAEHALLDALKIFGLGFSWGGFESLAIRCDPQLISRRFVKKLEGPLFRLHVGLESPADLIADLSAGLAAVDSYPSP
jgi:cystathionine beta-lyase